LDASCPDGQIRPGAMDLRLFPRQADMNGTNP
jgi:hypothetical protein